MESKNVPVAVAAGAASTKSVGAMQPLKSNNTMINQLNTLAAAVSEVVGKPPAAVSAAPTGKPANAPNRHARKPSAGASKDKENQITGTAAVGSSTAAAAAGASAAAAVAPKKVAVAKSLKLKKSVRTHKPTITSAPLSTLTGAVATPAPVSAAITNATATASVVAQIRRDKKRAGFGSNGGGGGVQRILYDQKWADKQERGFLQWMNHVLCVERSEQSAANEKKQMYPTNGAGVDVKSKPATVAATADQSVSGFLLVKLNALIRKRAFAIYHSGEVEAVIARVEQEVDAGRLVLRPNKDIYDDVGLRGALTDLLFTYDRSWLQLGVECVFGCLLPGFGDRKTIESFLNSNFFTNAEIVAKHPGFENAKVNASSKAEGQTGGSSNSSANTNSQHSGVPCFKKPLAVWTAKKFFSLVYLLDQLKLARIIPSDPCLFRTTAPAALKSSAAIITAFGAQFMSGVGNIVRHCSLLGYALKYQQPIVSELDFTVSSLATDLRDGVFLTRLADILTHKANGGAMNGESLLSKLRLPAETRARKIYNVELALRAFEKCGVFPSIPNANANAAANTTATAPAATAAPESATAVITAISTAAVSSSASSTNPAYELNSSKTTNTRIRACLTKADDVVDGHQEKTLALLWTISTCKHSPALCSFAHACVVNTPVMKWDVSAMLDTAALRAECDRVIRFVGTPYDADEEMFMASEQLEALLRWVKIVCWAQSSAHHAMSLQEDARDDTTAYVHNFTTSFSDGRALCLLVNYYHPTLLPLSEIKSMIKESGSGVESAPLCAAERKKESEKWIGVFSFPTLSERDYNANIERAKQNFALLNEKIRLSFGGAIPLLLNADDMVHGVPDEKVVITFLTYLCSRLLLLSKEIHACRRVQRVWRQKVERKAAAATVAVAPTAAVEANVAVNSSVAIAEAEAIATEQAKAKAAEEAAAAAAAAKEQAEAEAEILRLEAKRIEDERIAKEAADAAAAKQKADAERAAAEELRRENIRTLIREQMERARIEAELNRSRIEREEAEERRIQIEEEAAAAAAVHKAAEEAAAVAAAAEAAVAAAAALAQRVKEENELRIAEQLKAAEAARVAAAEVAAAAAKAAEEKAAAEAEAERVRLVAVAAAKAEEERIAAEEAARLVAAKAKAEAEAAAEAARIAAALAEEQRLLAVAAEEKRLADEAAAVKAAAEAAERAAAELKRRAEEEAAAAAAAAAAEAERLRVEEEERKERFRVIQAEWKRKAAEEKAAAEAAAAAAAAAAAEKARIERVEQERKESVNRAIRLQLQKVRNAVLIQSVWRMRCAKRELGQLRLAERERQIAIAKAKAEAEAAAEAARVAAVAAAAEAARVAAEIEAARVAAEAAAVAAAAEAERKRQLQELERQRIEKIATLVFQRRYRAHRASHIARVNFVASRRAAVLLQSRFRAHVKAATARRSFVALRQHTVNVQRRFRAMRVGHAARDSFLATRLSALNVQRRLRARNATRAVRSEFVSLRAHTRTVQNRFRARCAIRKAKKQLNELRAEKVAREKAAAAETARLAEVARLAEEARIAEIARLAAIEAEAKRVAEEKRIAEAKRVAAEAEAARVAAELAAAAEAKRLAEIAEAERVARVAAEAEAARVAELKRIAAAAEAARIAEEQRREAIARAEAKAAADRAKAAEEEKARLVASKAQSTTRAAIRIQSLYRGYRVRKANNKRMAAVRQRFIRASTDIRDDQRIGNRTRSALEVLLTSKNLSTIAKAVNTLDVVTRVLPSCCVDAADQNVVPVLYKLIASCNRSQPHLLLVQTCLQIIHTIAHNKITSRAAFPLPVPTVIVPAMAMASSVQLLTAAGAATPLGRVSAAALIATATNALTGSNPNGSGSVVTPGVNCIEILMEAMQVYRDKETIFCLVVGILTVGCRHMGFAQSLKNTGEVMKRMLSIHTILSHKCDMKEKYFTKSGSLALPAPLTAASAAYDSKSNAAGGKSSSSVIYTGAKSSKSVAAATAAAGNSGAAPSGVKACVMALTKLIHTIDTVLGTSSL